MNTKHFWNQLTLFIVGLLLLLVVREYFSLQLIKNGIESYRIHTLVGISANILLIGISYFFIKKNGLLHIAGLKGTKLKKWHLLIFPLIYVAGLNVLTMDDVNTDVLLPNILILLLYSLSVGISEELSIRDFYNHTLYTILEKRKRTFVYLYLLLPYFLGLYI